MEVGPSSTAPRRPGKRVTWIDERTLGLLAEWDGRRYRPRRGPPPAQGSLRGSSSTRHPPQEPIVSEPPRPDAADAEEEMEEQVRALQEEVRTLEKVIRSKNQALAQLSREINAEHASAGMQERLYRIEGELVEQRRANALLVEEKKIVDRENRTKERELARLGRDVASFQEKAILETQTIAQLEGVVKQLTDQIHGLEEENKALTRMQQVKTWAIDKLNKELALKSTFEDQYKDAMAQVHGLQKEIKKRDELVKRLYHVKVGDASKLTADVEGVLQGSDQRGGGGGGGSAMSPRLSPRAPMRNGSLRLATGRKASESMDWSDDSCTMDRLHEMERVAADLRSSIAEYDHLLQERDDVIDHLERKVDTLVRNSEGRQVSRELLSVGLENRPPIVKAPQPQRPPRPTGGARFKNVAAKVSTGRTVTNRLERPRGESVAKKRAK